MGLTEIQAALDGSYQGQDRLVQRLVRARAGLVASPHTAGWADVAVLVRQVLERWALTKPGRRRDQAVVSVPSVAPWPTADQWDLVSIVAETVSAGRLRLRPRPWHPSWFDVGDAEVVEAAIAEESRSSAQTVPADPLVEAMTEFKYHRSIGQRDAIRSIYLSPPASTVIAILPTGGGKSLVFQFAALFDLDRARLVVVIVPTTALAIDQAERFRRLVGPRLLAGTPLCYHSGLSDSEKSDLFRCLRVGNIPIVFTSPEAALGPLCQPLLAAARENRLSLFAIDEAHMVSQWGSFRPEFQRLAGLRDALLEACPTGEEFRTILFTATLTAEGYEVLTDFFGRTTDQIGGRQPIEVVCQLSLRCEPGYLLNFLDGNGAKDAKVARLSEALYHLPRPLLLYTTEVGDAVEWSILLTESLGFKRVHRVVGGDMAEAAGRTILSDWKAGDVDVIVATSAFGLGVDQDEVRSVIHACVPETLDRWYQEIGRGGRDGQASIALVVANSADLATATRMATELVIGHEKAFDRWNAMRHGGDREGDVYVVSLDALRGRYDVSSRRNQAWNLRTLAMMARAGLVRFALAPVAPPPAADQDPTAQTDLGVRIAVRITNPNHREQATFERAFRPIQEERREADRLDAARMNDLVKQNRSVHQLLAATYQISAAQVEVPRTLGDCPVTRKHGSVSHDPGEPCQLRPADAPLAIIAPKLERLFTELDSQRQRRLWIVYNRTDLPVDWESKSRLRLLARSLAALGIIEFAWPDVFGNLDWLALSAAAPGRYVYRAESADDPLVRSWQVPRLSLVGPDDRAPLPLVTRPWHVVVLPGDAPDHDRPGHFFLDRQRSLPLDIFEKRIAS
jgi:ATP-dependent DNA helicase RecQ